jgi:predicted transcriptional regulator
LPLSKKYRSYLEIIASILDSARGTNKDRYSLMRLTGINYAQLKRYLEPLIKIGFVVASIGGNRISYKATEKGLDFLGQYYGLLEMLLNAYDPEGREQIIYQAECSALNGSRNSDTRFPNNLQDNYALLLHK